MSTKFSAGLIFSTSIALAGAAFAVTLTKGQSTWVPQNHWLVPSLAVSATALFIWSAYLWRTTPAKHSNARVPALQEVKPLTQGQGSPAFAAGGNMYVNYPPTPHGSSPPPPHSTSKPEATLKAPNLHYAGSKQKLVFVSPDSRQGICDPQTSQERDVSLRALVLKFENKILADRKILRARNVIAKLRFHSANGATQQLIDYGVWLNSPCNTDDIGIGDTSELVLLCLMDGSLFSFEDKRRDGSTFTQNFSWLEDCNVDNLSMVEITIIDQDTQHILTLKLRVWLDGTSFCVAEI